jgi:Na+/H+ antiporter NhaC
MKHLNYYLLFGFLLSFQFSYAQEDTTTADTDTFSIETTIDAIEEGETDLLENITEQLYLNVKTKDGTEYLEIYTACSDGLLTGKTTLSINNEPFEVAFKDCQTRIPYEIGDGKLILLSKGSHYDDFRLIHISPQKNATTPYRIKYIPLWMSIVPPLVAIILALIFKEVIISLFIGIWSGVFIANGMRFDPVSIILSFYETVSNYIINAVTDPGHMSVIIFSLMIGGMVAIISRNGGMAGVVEKLSKYAKTTKSTELVTWFLGIAIFFDDYANTLIVGNTMRSVTDKFKISREKLAYIVDSTAAPVAAVAFITTWIGVELGYIKDNMHDLPGLDTIPSAYSVFLSSLQYSFYPILTLIFILILIFTRRDYGAMYKAEKRARGGEVLKIRGEVTSLDMEDLAPVKGAELRWYNAAIPVFTVIAVTIIGLIATGTETSLANLVENGYTGDTSITAIWANLYQLSDAENVGFFECLGILIGNADSYTALIWASLSGLVLGILLTLGGRIMKLEDTMNTMLSGFRTMLPALMILALAWSLGTLTEELNTATFLTSMLQDSLPPELMPVVIFILAGAIAFSTGSSWSTMAILYPIAIPSTWAICMANGYEVDVALPILYNVIATVLAASVFGDHCSPISDTTILSSLASDCNHLDHVQTQLPYALTVGIVSMGLGYVATAFNIPGYICLGIGVTILFLVVRIFGKVID